MKIGYVLKFFPKLSETFILNEIIELTEKGHEITIFSINHPQESIMHPEIRLLNLLDNVVYLPNQKFSAKLRFRLKVLGFSGWKYPSENLKERFLAIASAKYFSDIAKELKLDILHAHFNGIAPQVAMLMSKKLSLPFTFTVHAFDIFINPNMKALKRRINNSLQTIAISKLNKNYLENLTDIRKKIKVIHACPNLDRINKTKKNKKSSKGKFNLISVARLVEKKGIKYAILALKELIPKYNLNYLIIGKGPLKKELAALIRKLKLEKNIKLIEALTNRELLEKIKESDVFLLPCIKAKNKDVDGIPVALMEAMALEKPIVSTIISGIPELVENKKNGFLVEPKNIKQLTTTIKNLLEDKKLRMKIGKNAKKKIEKEFNIHKEVNKLLKIWGKNEN